ncbi:MAG TPA: Fur family transcriptional regulator [Coriobacteriia bacterium]|nr:Fur family transcriptional regulator [Coriobacteriia bacterium]
MTRSRTVPSLNGHEYEQGIARELRARGLRPTRARCHVLAHLRSSECHPCAEEITLALRDEGHEVGAATVYQNLNRLVESGLVSRVTGVDGRLRFDAELAPHDHAVCQSCGRIADVAIESRVKRVVDRVTIDGPHVSGWLIKGAHVQVSGVCPECRRS